MAEITLEKNHALLEKLAEYVMNEVSTKQEVDEKIGKVDTKIDKLAEYVLNEVATKKEVDEKFQKVDENFQKVDENFQKVDGKFQKVYDAIWNVKEELDQKADKKDVEMLKNNLRELLDGQDAMVNQLDIIRTEQYAFNAAFTRLEERVESLESGI